MSVIINDPRLFDDLIVSQEQYDDEIIKGIIEADSKGQSVKGIIAFNKFPLTGDIAMNKIGEKTNIIISKNVVIYLKTVIREREKYGRQYC